MIGSVSAIFYINPIIFYDIRNSICSSVLMVNSFFPKIIGNIKDSGVLSDPVYSRDQGDWKTTLVCKL